MPELFDMKIRALRRDRAARKGVELFLYERAFADCVDRIGTLGRKFDRALLIGCPDPRWPSRLKEFASDVTIVDPGPCFAHAVGGKVAVEDALDGPPGIFDLVVAVGTLDTVNNLPLALHILRHGMSDGAALIGACSGGDTLPRLRFAMRAADQRLRAAAPHVHPRIEPSALAGLIGEAGFSDVVVDVDRVPVSYPSLQRLVADLRAMGAGNVLHGRPMFISRSAFAAASRAFTDDGDGHRTTETFEVLHFAGWTPAKG